MTDYKKLQYDNTKVQVESAIRDGNGVRIDTNYQRKPAVYERTTYSDTSTTCTLIQFNASDYKANGYLAHFRFRVRSVLQDAYPSDNEFIINYSYRDANIICTNSKKTTSNDIVQDIYAYHPNSDTYLDTGNYFIAFKTGRASTGFIIEMIDADVSYTVPATMSASTTTNTSYQSLSPGGYTSFYPLMWAGTAVGNITGSAASASSASSATKSDYAYGTKQSYFLIGETDGYKLMAVDHTGVAYKINTSTKKFPLPISMYWGANSTAGSITSDGYTSTRELTLSYLTSSSYNDFTMPTLTADDGGKTLYVRGSLDADGYFVCDGNVTLSGYTYIPFGILTSKYSGSTAQVPTNFSFNAISAAAYTLDANGKLTHVDGKEVGGGGSVQYINQSVTFALQSTPDYADYPYRASFTITDITSDTFANVVYSAVQSASGNYASFCRTDTDVIYLYAKTDVGEQTIPTISVGYDYSDIAIAQLNNKVDKLVTKPTAGTYTSVTVNGEGQVTGGSNPTTLAGYGITDAVPALTTAPTAGDYTKVTINADGLVTAGTNPTTLSGYGITDAVNTTGDQTGIAGAKTWTGVHNWSNPLTVTSVASDCFKQKNSNLPANRATFGSNNIDIGVLSLGNASGTNFGQIEYIEDTSLRAMGLRLYSPTDNAWKGIFVQDRNGTTYATALARAYNSANTSDIVTIGSLASNPSVVHTTGNETVNGEKTFNATIHRNTNIPLTVPGSYTIGNGIIFHANDTDKTRLGNLYIAKATDGKLTLNVELMNSGGTYNYITLATST